MEAMDKALRAPQLQTCHVLFVLSNFPTKNAVLTTEREEVPLRLTQHGNKDLLVGREVPAVIRNLMTVCRWCTPRRLPPPPRFSFASLSLVSTVCGWGGANGTHGATSKFRCGQSFSQ